MDGAGAAAAATPAPPPTSTYAAQPAVSDRTAPLPCVPRAAGGDLDPNTTEQELEQLFGSVGPCRAQLRPAARGPSAGAGAAYAVVAFQTSEHAAAALERLKHARLRGRALRPMHPPASPLASASPPHSGPPAAGFTVQLQVHPMIT